MKHIGVAVGQNITQTARPLPPLLAKNGQLSSWDGMTKLINRWRPDALVTGIPVNMDGSEQWVGQYAREFAQQLRDQYALPVYEVDERLTTKEAREQLFLKGGYQALQDGQVDSVAAQLILQTWFAEQRHAN
jgi:putative Holliday junction resolvase